MWATVSATIVAAPSGSRSSRHQHSDGSSTVASSQAPRSPSIRSPIWLAAAANARKASSGRACTTKLASSRSTTRIRRGRPLARGAGRGLAGRLVGGAGEAAGAGACRRTARIALSYAVFSSRMRASSPPWSGCSRWAIRRRAALSSARVAVGGTPSTAKGSGELMSHRVCQAPPADGRPQAAGVE